MKLLITEFFNNACPRDYAASVAEIGADAGKSTWRAACEDSSDYPLLDDDDKRAEFREFVLSSGGWSKEEVQEWTDTELNALCLQWIAGDVRQAGLSADSDADDWAQYVESAEQCRCSGNLFKADDGQIYFYIGS